MIEWVTVISLILFGMFLLIAEIIFVPGTTIVGIIGFLSLFFGVGLSFNYFGSETGWITVGISSVVSGGILYYAFKVNLWRRFSLKNTSDSKFNEGHLDALFVGMEGHTISALRPIGKAELNNKQYEVKTMGKYLDSGCRIKVIRIISNQIIVEPLN
jgi:membrane-bound ClpP family serine protease